MKKPCFVRCVAAYTNEAGKRLEAKAGVGFDAEKIRAGIPLPQDFDAFWAAARKERDAIPMDVRMTNRWKLANHDVMKISVANVQNSRFYGFLRVPRSGSGPRPAFLFIPGAGGGTDAGPRTEVVPFIMAGAITLAVHVHPYDVPPFDGERPDYKKVYNSGYSRQGGPDPKSYYFYKTILGIDRMIDYLAAREDWDGKHLVVQGISQGGGLSLIVAGLNSKVTAVAASIPGMCDHAAYRVGNVNGWPGLIPGHLRGQSGPEEELWANFAGYYDAANFAPRIRGPVISTVGLIDEAGRAAPAFAVFNRIATPKAMFTWSNGRHTDAAAYAKMKTAWIKGQLGLDKPIAPTMSAAEGGGR
jgi:cephalosporin-C deacetylase-like acetyl esterase